jgi:signal transduction histidine kinase
MTVPPFPGQLEWGMAVMSQEIQERAVAAIAKIDVVPMILEVVCQATGLGFSAVARVTEDHWIACAVRDTIGFGLKPGGELELKTTICNEIRQTGQLVAIDHASEDPAFCRHPTPEMYGFQSYISVPIQLPGGEFFGTLCAIDPKPARVNTPETINMFRLFANLIGMHLDTQDRLGRTNLALADERAQAELREQFIAVLGHDLRNPLSAIQGGAFMLKAITENERVTHAAGIIERASRRMAGLIDDVMDFAKGRLGGGLAVTRAGDGHLGAMIEQVVTEMRTARPEHEIQCTIELTQPVTCDSPRIGQLLSNLIGNALTHGDGAGPVRVAAWSGDGRFELSVTNTGEPIPANTRARLFQPFARMTAGTTTGLGLGLYIASEIARAHDGTLSVSSTKEATRFTLSMPAA